MMQKYTKINLQNNKIRKQIVSFFRQCSLYVMYFFSTPDISDFISWHVDLVFSHWILYFGKKVKNLPHCVDDLCVLCLCVSVRICTNRHYVREILHQGSFTIDSKVTTWWKDGERKGLDVQKEKKEICPQPTPSARLPPCSIFAEMAKRDEIVSRVTGIFQYPSMIKNFKSRGSSTSLARWGWGGGKCGLWSLKAKVRRRTRRK